MEFSLALPGAMGIETAAAAAFTALGDPISMVRALSVSNGKVLGLNQSLIVGSSADIVVFDPDKINAGEIILLNDLPGGEGRLYADVKGMHRVFVNGVVTVMDNEPTDNLPGTILKSGQDTYTVKIPADV